jgi:hypothetical protein
MLIFNQTLFCQKSLFSEKKITFKLLGKRRTLLDQLLAIESIDFLGARPQSRESAEPRIGYGAISCEAEQRFLLLFLEKEEYCLIDC